MFSVSHSNQGGLFENIVAEPIANGVLCGTAATLATYALPAIFPINPLIAGVFIATIEILNKVTYNFFSHLLISAKCKFKNHFYTYLIANFASLYIGISCAPLTLPYTLKITSVALSALQTLSLYILSLSSVIIAAKIFKP